MRGIGQSSILMTDLPVKACQLQRLPQQLGCLYMLTVQRLGCLQSLEPEGHTFRSIHINKP